MIRNRTILIIHNYYQIPGGEDTVVSNEKKMLEENGNKVILYSRNNSELKEMSMLKKMVLPFMMVFSLRTYREVKKIIREKHIDIVHVHNTLNLVSPAVYYAAISCKIPVVQTIHNFRLICPGATFYRDGHICEDCVVHGLSCAVKYGCYRGSKAQTLACVINTKIHRLAGIYRKLNYICLTEFNKEKLLSLSHIMANRVFVKPNFADSSCEIVPYEERANQFVFAGRIDKLKGIEILLEAWKRMGSDVPKLVICGTGPMEDWSKKYILDNELSNVEMMGFVSNTEARKIIANSKALILPTQWYEGFPMTIVEAYSAGTPVIGSDIGNVGSVIEEGVTGFRFKYNNPNALIDAVKAFDNRIWRAREYYDLKLTQLENYKVLMEIYSEVEK